MVKRRRQSLKNHAFRNSLQRYWPQITTLLGMVILMVFFFHRGKFLQYSYQLDDIAREPIIAPFNFPILKSEEKLQTDLEAALHSVPFVFNRRQDIVEEQIKKIDAFFRLLDNIHAAREKLAASKDLVYRYRYTDRYDETRAIAQGDSAKLAALTQQLYNEYPFTETKDIWKTFLTTPDVIPPDQLPDLKTNITQICRNRWAEGIIDIKNDKIISNEVALNQDDVPILMKPEELNDLNRAWTKSKVEITQIYTDENDPQRQYGYDLIVEFMKPNIIYDKETTERHQQARLNRVPRHQGIVLKDEMIVDANQRITTDVLQKLESLTVALSKQTNRERGWAILTEYLGRFIIISVVVSFFFTFLLIYRRPTFEVWKLVLLIALIFTVEVGLSDLFVYRFGFSAYLIPITAAAMLLTVLFDARIGFMGTTSIALLCGILIGNDVEFIVTALFTSSVAMYTVRRLQSRTQFFVAIFVLAGASLLVVLGHGLLKGHGWKSMGFDSLYLLVNSTLSPIIAYGLVGILEISFGITTDLTLLELLDFNHPLLKRMQREANGTFNHSIVVGNLAESCATAVGARSLLCRVGAYYHDIGKMGRPEYFIENQYAGENKHEGLTPVMSAKIIRNHVKEGLRLAEEYHLPKVISDFIPMHHGTTRVEYFYRQALEEAGGDAQQVDERTFRYPGPKPNTKETGILMICEAVEAAVRSLKDPNIMKIEDMIDKIINKRLREGQLDECPLTLDELRRIKGTVDGTIGMLPVLRGIYHIRIEYPEEKPPAENASNRT